MSLFAKTLLAVAVVFAASSDREVYAGDAYDAYLEAKVAWTGKPDAAKLRKAFFKNAFGAGQFDMAEFLLLLEKKEDDRFTAAEVARLEWLVRDALGNVAGPETACGKRIVEVRKRLLDPIAERTDGIRDGVHDYCADNYKAPTDPAVVAALERFRDRKLALMVHFGIYATRVCAPYRTGDWAFTQGKDNGPVYAIRLWKECEKGVRRLVLPAGCAEKVVSVVHLASGLRAPAVTRSDGTVSFELPDGTWADDVADAFRVE